MRNNCRGSLESNFERRPTNLIDTLINFFGDWNIQYHVTYGQKLPAEYQVPQEHQREETVKICEIKPQIYKRKCHAHREFECDDKSCILRNYWCDGIPDCLDNSDEKNCG